MQTMYELYKEARVALIEWREEYEQECMEYAERGYRPHYCIHGVDMWVDYDPICGRCESDELPDTVQAYIMARNEFRRLQHLERYANV